eukprot:12426114-Karenia_brevis.AAC.1
MSNSNVGGRQSCTAKSPPPREGKRGGEGGGETPSEGADPKPTRSEGRGQMGWLLNCGSCAEKGEDLAIELARPELIKSHCDSRIPVVNR